MRTEAAELVFTGSEWVPAWLGPKDHPWLQALLDELQRFDGATVREWTARAAEPLRVPCPPQRQRRVAALLAARAGTVTSASRPSPRERRLSVFLEAQAQRDAKAFSRAAVFESVGKQLGVDAKELERELFADLPGERRLAIAGVPQGAAALCLEANLQMAQALLRRAGLLQIDLSGGSRPIVRQLLLKRLLCTVRPCGAGVRLEVSGPFALFRHTTLYGRALASTLPALRGADRFVVRAQLEHAGRRAIVRIASGDPVFPQGLLAPRFDSTLEERFARDFAKAAPGWDLVREPEPIAVADTWLFPDFALVDRREPSRRWLLEIVGFWTPEYLRSKLERLRAAGRSDLILCVDERFLGPEAALPTGAKVVPFHRIIDAASVARIVGAG